MKGKTRKIGKMEINSKLVEVLAAFAVIVVLLLIISPIVYNMLQNVRKTTYHINEDLMITATKHYVALNPGEMSLNVGDSKSVDITVLVAEELIGEIYSAGTKTLCVGNIIVFRETETKYTYTPYLKCNGYETER